MPTLSITTPDGPETVPNPLVRYVFPVDMIRKKYFGPLSNAPNIPEQPNTVRHYDSVTGQSNHAAASRDLQASSAGRLSKTYTLLSNIGDYTSFSLYHWGGSDIEAIHGDIHNSVGGLIGGNTATGHMTITSISAFDPAFWLHHANVDRLVALWQALHPDQYVQPIVNKHGTYYLPSGSTDTVDTPLAPFRSDDATTMWTAATARDTTVFGYTYPELNITNASTSELKRIVTEKVNRLYSPLGTPFTNRTRPTRSQRSINVAKAMSKVHADTALQLGVNNMEIQWYLRVSIEAKAALNDMAMFLFIGQPIPDVDSWPRASNLIGSHTPYFANNASEILTSLQQIDIPCSHTVAAAVNRGILAHITPEVVVPFLARNVVAKVASRRGAAMDGEYVPSVEISILSREVQPRKNISEFPVYGILEERASIIA